MSTCMRCHRSTAVTPKSPTPLLLLCAACEVFPDCGEYRHPYGGNLTGSGTWVCPLCGATQGSQTISATPVNVPVSHPPADMD